MPATPSETLDDRRLCRVLKTLRETPAIFDAIAENSGQELSLQRELRKRYPDDVVRGALVIAELRQRAAGKFDRTAQMWFDRVGLEQATSAAVARHKAIRFWETLIRKTRFCGVVDDLCCGVGGDALAMAAAGCEVRAVDLRESMTMMTHWNAEACDVGHLVKPVVGDARDIVGPGCLMHIDPDRRAGTGRSIRIEDYEPALGDLDRLMDERPGGAIKLSPASNFGGKFPGCEVELVSLRGECKEATVWFGELAGEANQWRATVLSGVSGENTETVAGDPLSVRAEIGSLSTYLFDPDPAVVRSGMLDVVADQLDLQRLDPEEEYLTGDTLPASTFVTPFEVLADLPNNDKSIRRYFREQSFGQVEIKCRRIPIDIERLRRKLSLKGTDAATLVFARIDGRARAVVCRRLPNDS